MGTMHAAFFGGFSYTFSAIIAANFSGVSTSGGALNHACNSASCNALAASSTSLTSQNVTTTQAHTLLIVSGVTWNGGETPTGANSYSLADYGSTPFLFYKSVTATGTYPNGNFATLNSADQYISFFDVFGNP